jgi:hypothetical protein
MTMLEAVKQALVENGLPEPFIEDFLVGHQDEVEHLVKVKIPEGQERLVIDKLKEHQVSNDSIAKFFECKRTQKTNLN